MASAVAERRARIRETVLRHVTEHPHAADTAAGILASWLPGAGFEDAPDHIEAVLAELCAERWLLARRLPDGNILYVRGAGAQREP